MNRFLRVSRDTKVIDVIFSFEYLITVVLLPASVTSHGCTVSKRMFIHDTISDSSQQSAA